MPIDLFFSYSHKDEELRGELETHLALLEDQGVIRGWHAGKIEPGIDWEEQIIERLDGAHIVLLLISSDFLASRYCRDVELKRALERHRSGQIRVIPVVLRACDWKRGSFAHLQALPKDGKAVKSWTDRDEAWTDVTLGIRAAAESMLEEQVDTAEREPAGARDSAPPPSRPRPISVHFFEARPVSRPSADFVGIVPVHSSYYVSRVADDEFTRLLLMPRSFPYILEPRHTGKSSLLVRSLARAAGSGARTAHVDLQLMGCTEIDEYESFARSLAHCLSDSLQIPSDVVSESFSERLPTGWRLTNFLDATLRAAPTLIVIAFDCVDMLLNLHWGEDFLRLVRAWHNKGATQASWAKHLNVALVGSSEPHDLIPGTAGSPFNVGQRVELLDFSVKEIGALADAYGLATDELSLGALKELLGGHPAQTHRLFAHAAASGCGDMRMILADRILDVLQGELAHARQMLNGSVELRRFLEQLGDAGAELDGRSATALYRMGVLRREGSWVYWRSRLYRDHLLGRR